VRGGAGGSGAAIAGRQWTSRILLRWDWDHVAGRASPLLRAGRQLTQAEALTVLAGDDGRPLLVLRECRHCEGSEDAFLSREFDNEKTMLLGRWFHAVKLPVSVTDGEHPLHALFDGKDPPHLFTATADGTLLVPLDGRQSQGQLWKAMTSVLRRAYTKDPESAVSTLRGLLDKLDDIDSRLADLEERQAGEPGSSPAGKRLEKDHGALVAAREALIEKGALAEDLKLRAPHEDLPAPGPSNDSAGAEKDSISGR
jgi:hypothetical protein